VLSAARSHRLTRLKGVAEKCGAWRVPSTRPGRRPLPPGVRKNRGSLKRARNLASGVTDSRLRQMQPPGCVADAAFGHHGVENHEKIEVDRPEINALHKSLT
jgi:hypothetical protein